MILIVPGVVLIVLCLACIVVACFAARKRRWLLSGVAISIFVLLLFFGVVIGVLTGVWNVTRLAVHERSYRAQAEQIVRAEAPHAQEGVLVLQSPAEAKRVYYVHYQGSDFVYFELRDELTVSDGLIYSASGAEPPAQNGDIDASRVSHNWFVVEFVNGIFEYGRIDP